MQKKHVAICYHVVREAVAVGAQRMAWLESDGNYADLFTKTTIPSERKRRMFDELLYYDRFQKMQKVEA